MLTIFIPRGSTLEQQPAEIGVPIPESAVWLDLVNPTSEEDKMVERLVGIAIPTREEMQEIELSSRLYVENGARYMTATLMCQSDTPVPKTTPVTFILAGQRLVTVRYDEPRPFAIIRHKLGKSCPLNITGQTLLMDLLDAVIDRAADILERIGNRGRPGLAGYFRSPGGRAPIARATTTRSCSRSAARATSPPRCARAWSRSDG